MKITPLEIRQKSFQKGFRGYDKDEVEAFLLSLSQEWERLQEDYKELKIKLEQSVKEVSKLKEVEDSLFKTLKTAETTGANVVEQANKTAELILQEAKLKAEQTIDNAQRKSDKVFTQMLTEFSELEREFRNIENLRDNLVSEIRNLANDSVSKISKIDSSRKDFSHIKSFVTKLNVEESNEIPVPNIKSESENKTKPIVENTPKQPMENSLKSVDVNEYPKSVENTPRKPEVENTPKSTDDSSFFDQIN